MIETGFDFLIVDDDEVFAATLSRSLLRRGFRATVAHNATEALDAAQHIAFAAVTLDLHLGQDSGLKLVAPLRQLLPHARLLVLTGFASIATAVAAVKLGADDYLAKPANTDSILAAMRLDKSPTLTDDEIPEVASGPMSVPRLEWEHIQRVLAQCEGNISEAARRLRMHRRTLQRKLAKHPVRE